MKNREDKVWAFAVSLIAQLGFMIALPIAGLAYLGRVADKAWGTSPAFLLGGIALSGVVSSLWIVSQTRRLRDRYLEMLAPREKNDTQL